MMETISGRNIKAILLAAWSALSILVILIVVVLALIWGTNSRTESASTGDELVSMELTTGALLLAAALIARTGLLAWERIRGLPESRVGWKPISFWLALTLLFGWSLTIGTALFLSQQTVLQWFTLPFHLIAIGLPVYVLARMAAGGLNIGDKLHAWGTFSLGMTAAPLFSLLAEGMTALFLLIGIGVFIGFNPQRLEAIQTLVTQLENIPSQEQALVLLAPILANPLIWLGGLFFLSLVTPLAEEFAKSLPLLLGGRSLTSPAQGFALGALSGAGFALMEGLFISITPGASWGATLTVRAASSAMHILTAGLTGWGITKASLQKRLLPALGGYTLAATIHGLWNAGVVTMAFSAGRMLSAPAAPDVLSSLLALLGLGLLGLLIPLAPLAIWLINRQLQKPTSSIVIQSSEGNVVR